jgi:hypothetical protein
MFNFLVKFDDKMAQKNHERLLSLFNSKLSHSDKNLNILISI